MWSPPNTDTAQTPAPSADHRNARRKRVLMTAVICDAHGQQVQDCTLRDVSESGARVGFARTTRPAEILFLINIRERIVHHAKLVWQNGLEAGIGYTGTTPLAELRDPSLGFLRKLWMERATR